MTSTCHAVVPVIGYAIVVVGQEIVFATIPVSSRFEFCFTMAITIGLFLCVIFSQATMALRSYQIDKEIKWALIFSVEMVCLTLYSTIRLVTLPQSPGRLSVYTGMIGSSIGSLASFAVLWFIQKADMEIYDDLRRDLLCPVSLDDKSANLTIETIQGDVDVIPMDSLSWLRAQCDDDQIYVYLKETEGLIRYRVFQFWSEEEARLAVEKINNHVKNESFPITKV